MKKNNSFLVLITLFGILCSCDSKYTFEDITMHKTKDVIEIMCNTSIYMSSQWNIKHFRPVLDMIDTTYKVVNEVMSNSVNDYDYGLFLSFKNGDLVHFYVVNDRIYTGTLNFDNNKSLESTNKIDLEKLKELINIEIE